MTERAQLGVVGGKSLLGLGAIVAPSKLQVGPVAVFGAQQTAGGNKAAQAAHREGTARIAEQVDVITGLVVERQEAIGAQNVGAQPLAAAAAGEPLDQATNGAHAGIVVKLLTEAPGSAQIDEIGEDFDVALRRGAVGIVPGAIETNHEVHHARPFCSSRPQFGLIRPLPGRPQPAASGAMRRLFSQAPSQGCARRRRADRAPRTPCGAGTWAPSHAVLHTRNTSPWRHALVIDFATTTP